jgi:hypothetical protein
MNPFAVKINNNKESIGTTSPFLLGYTQEMKNMAEICELLKLHLGGGGDAL